MCVGVGGRDARGGEEGAGERGLDIGRREEEEEEEGRIRRREECDLVWV